MSKNSAALMTKEVSDLLVKFDTGTTFNNSLYADKKVKLDTKNLDLKKDISHKLTKLILEKPENFNAVFTSETACKILTDENFSAIYAQYKDGENFTQSKTAQKNYNAKLRTCKEYITDQITLFNQALDSNKRELPQKPIPHSTEADTMLNFFSNPPSSPKPETSPKPITPSHSATSPSSPQSTPPSTPPPSPSSRSKEGLPSIVEGREPTDISKKRKPK